jgi:hypothetical protein
LIIKNYKKLKKIKPKPNLKFPSNFCNLKVNFETIVIKIKGNKKKNTKKIVKGTIESHDAK